VPSFIYWAGLLSVSQKRYLIFSFRLRQKAEPTLIKLQGVGLGVGPSIIS
jgi:hypothetical protein